MDISSTTDYNAFEKFAEKIIEQSGPDGLIELLSYLFGTFVIICEGKFVAFDDEFAQLLGYSRDELIKTPVLDIVLAEEQDNVKTHIKNELTDIYNTRLVSKTGTVKYVTISPRMFSACGKRYRLTQFQDFTERHEKELLLRQSNLIIENSPVVLFLWRAEEGWPVEFVSENINQYGYTADDFIDGKIAYDAIIHPDDLAKVSEEVTKNSEKKIDEFSQEYRLVSPDGKIHWIDDRTTILRNNQGEITHYQGIILDITEKKSLMQFHTELGSIIQESLNEIYILNIDTFKFISANLGAQKNLQYDLDELQQMSPVDITPDIKMDQVHEILTQLLDGEEKNLTVETIHQRKDESTYPVELHIQAIPYQGKTAILAHAIDITQRKATEKLIQRTESALKNLVNVNDIIIYAKSENELLEEICESLIKNGKYKFVWIGYAEQDAKKSVNPVAYFGDDPSYIEALDIHWADVPSGQGPTGTAIRERKPVIAKDIHNDPLYKPWRERAESYGFQSSAALPLITGNEVLGTINLYSREPNAFDQEEIDLLQELATNVAYGIKTQRLVASELEYLQRHKSALLGTITAIAKTVEKRDPYTSGHMDRVAELVTAIAKKIGLSDTDIDGLRLAATIHDLGKIYIPSELLNRPGKLTAAEFGLIKTHSQVGYDIIKDIDFPWPVADMIHQHHERLDGSGYPQGLKGDEILLESQIIAVADVVEAVSSSRPYRPANSIQEGLSIIRNDSGTKLNPEIVNACIEIIEKDGFSFSSKF